MEKILKSINFKKEVTEFEDTIRGRTDGKGSYCGYIYFNKNLIGRRVKIKILKETEKTK